MSIPEVGLFQKRSTIHSPYKGDFCHPEGEGGGGREGESTSDHSKMCYWACKGGGGLTSNFCGGADVL